MRSYPRVLVPALDVLGYLGSCHVGNGTVKLQSCTHLMARSASGLCQPRHSVGVAEPWSLRDGKMPSHLTVLQRLSSEWFT